MLPLFSSVDLINRRIHMTTIQFQINPSHIKHFISERSKGVCVEATNLDTQETGWLYIGHNTDWWKHRKLLSSKVTWVLSCYLNETQLSPFPGGNRYEMVKTTVNSMGLLVAQKVKRQPLPPSSDLPPAPPPPPISTLEELGESSLEEIPIEDRIGELITDEEFINSLYWTRVRNKLYACQRINVGQRRYFCRAQDGVIEVTENFYDR